MSTKYQPLRRWLEHRRDDRVRLSFREIESILECALPDSARRLPQWWANAGGSHVQALAWMAAGWRASQVDVSGEQVTFERSQRKLLDDPSTGFTSVAETGPAFVADDAIVIDRASLRGGALRLLEDYREAQGGTLADAAAGLLNAMWLERRRQMLERFPLTGDRSDIDSVDLIRAERDAR
jgi:hypothetical protein